MAHRHDKHTTVSASVQNSRGSSVHTQSKSQRRRKSFFTSAVHYYVISGCRRLQLLRSPFHGEHHDGARRARFVEPSLDPRPCQPVHRAEHASAVRRVFGGCKGSFEGPRAVLSKTLVLSTSGAQKHAFWHLHLQGDGSTMAPQCNAAESTETRRLPPLRR